MENAPHHRAAGRRRRAPAGRRAQRPRPAARRGDVSRGRALLERARAHPAAGPRRRRRADRRPPVHLGRGRGVQGLSRARRLRASSRCSRPASIVAIISGRDSAAVRRRAAELGIRHVAQGVGDKAPALAELVAELGVARRRSRLRRRRHAGRADAAQAAASPSRWPTRTRRLAAAAHCVTSASGGHGAVREVCDLLLSARANPATSAMVAAAAVRRRLRAALRSARRPGDSNDRDRAGRRGIAAIT